MIFPLISDYQRSKVNVWLPLVHSTLPSPFLAHFKPPRRLQAESIISMINQCLFEALTEVARARKHGGHVSHLGHIPSVDVLVEGACFIRHFRHGGHI